MIRPTAPTNIRTDPQAKSAGLACQDVGRVEGPRTRRGRPEKLLDSAVITQAEFDAIKAKAIGSATQA
jgi:hypothetical protein